MSVYFQQYKVIREMGVGLYAQLDLEQKSAWEFVHSD